MSLDITFYSQNRETNDIIECSADFYEYLSKSEFSKIGKSQEEEMKGDEESVLVSVIILNFENRNKYSDFFRNEIVKESDRMLEILGDSPSKEEYKQASSKLQKLQVIRKLIEDEKHKYLSKTE